MKTKLLFIPCLAVLAFATGCANVKPWQRGSLAEESMSPDHNAANTVLAEHMWFSREAATGGRSLGGGGCGCN